MFKVFFLFIIIGLAATSLCAQGITDFSLEDSYPLAVLFTGKDCSTGVLTTTYGHIPNMYDIFFNESRPEHVIYGWNGTFEEIKFVTN